MDMHPTGGSPAATVAGSGLGVAGAEEERLREEYQNDDDCLVLRPMVDVVAAHVASVRLVKKLCW
jgi:hypothetical protein